jgi:hypothetical protein
MEQFDYNGLFLRFVRVTVDDPVWDATVFTKNREHLLVGEMTQGFFNAVVEQAAARGLQSKRTSSFCKERPRMGHQRRIARFMRPRFTKKSSRRMRQMN